MFLHAEEAAKRGKVLIIQVAIINDLVKYYKVCLWFLNTKLYSYLLVLISGPLETLGDVQDHG
jgi:hypothetical protein